MNLYDASLKLTEEAYRALPMLSYSALSRYDREGYECLATLFDKITSPSLTFGSMVDTLITAGDIEFFNKYAAMEFTPPTESMLAVANHLLGNQSAPMLITVPDEDILLAADVCGFYKNWKPQTRLDKLREGISEYYDFRKGHTNCELVSPDMMSSAIECAHVLQSDPITRGYFAKPDAFSNFEVYYQLQFASEIDGLQYKGMLDLVKIDHDKKVIFPCDLKTTKSIYTFEESFYKYRYYLQAAMYTQLLKDTIAKSCPELADYDIAPYRFIVIDKTNVRPVVFSWTLTDKVTTPEGEVRKSWQELLKQIVGDIQCLDAKLPKSWYEQMTHTGIVSLN